MVMSRTAKIPVSIQNREEKSEFSLIYFSARAIATDVSILLLNKPNVFIPF